LIYDRRRQPFCFGTFLKVYGLLVAVPITAVLVTGYRAYQEEPTLDLSEYGTF
jgi:predicted PurR-regulated permease PerM